MSVIVATCKDITERKKSEKLISHLSNHDLMTDLPNERYFYEQLATRREGASAMTVCIVRIDQLHMSSRMYDRPNKSHLLKELGARIRDCLREDDLLCITAESMFMVLLTHDPADRPIEAWTAKLCRRLKEPVVLQDEEAYPNIHAGIASCPKDAQDDAELVRLAYYQLGQAVADHAVAAFAGEASRGAYARSAILERELRQAIKAGELELYYQPKLTMADDRICGAEALIRWNHPKQGLKGPDSFILFAEEIGLIVPIGEWVIREACLQLRQWMDLGMAPFPISVNLSVRQFLHNDIVDIIGDSLRSTGIDPSLLMIEITESMCIEDGQAVEIIARMKRLGVHISMDDFGKGYRSLGCLKRFPLDKVKIDKAFIRDMTSDSKGMKMVEAIIRMVHALELEAVAEGVETREQYELLRSLKCDEWQGYLGSKPLPAATFFEYVQNRTGGVRAAVT